MNLELIENQLKHAISIVQEMKRNQKEKTKMVDTLKIHLIEVLEMVEETDDLSDEESWSDSDSDASFTQEELTYIKNESHKEYLKRYSLKPKFPSHYFNADRDVK